MTCPACGRAFLAGPPAAALPGGLSGGSADVAGPGGSLLLACVASGGYVLDSRRQLLRLIFGPILAAAVIPLVLAIIPLGIFAVVPVEFLIAGYIWSYYVQVARNTAAGLPRRARLPEFSASSAIRTGLLIIGMTVVYILPVITLPLAPLGLLALAVTGDWRALDVFWAVRTAVRNIRALGVVLMGWVIWMVLSMVPSIWFPDIIAQVQVRFATGEAGARRVDPFLQFSVLTGLMFVQWTWSALCSVGAWRCVGLLGCHAPDTVTSIPRPRYPERAVGSVLLAGAMIVGVICLLAHGYDVAAQVASWTDFRNDQQKLADGRESIARLADAIRHTSCRRGEPLMVRGAIRPTDLYSGGNRKLKYVFTADEVGVDHSWGVWVYDPTVYIGGVMLVIDDFGKVQEWTGPQLAEKLKAMGMPAPQARGGA